ncbi:MAG: hypothetical protein JHC93_02840 [Parachlamydiales bacterium]|nr:hypothetical protein [Parachlamydiales bacterium]
MEKHTSTNLNIYCQSHGLLFQFLLREFLTVFKVVQHIEHLVGEIEGDALLNFEQTQELPLVLTNLYQAITHLTGKAVINEPHFPWSTDRGCLNKLHHYCYLFAHLCPGHKKETAEMNACVRKAFHSAQESRETTICIHQELVAKRPLHGDLTILFSLLDKIIDNISKASRLIIPITLDYRHDENVLYFILNHRESLDSLYQSSFLSNIFEQMYPGGALEVKEFLIRQYSKRGFHHLLTNINQKMAVLGG